MTEHHQTHGGENFQNFHTPEQPSPFTQTQITQNQFHEQAPHPEHAQPPQGDAAGALHSSDQPNQPQEHNQVVNPAAPPVEDASMADPSVVTTVEDPASASLRLGPEDEDVDAEGDRADEPPMKRQRIDNVEAEVQTQALEDDPVLALASASSNGGAGDPYPSE